MFVTSPKDLDRLPGAAPVHQAEDLGRLLVDHLEEALRLGRLGLPELPRHTLVTPRLQVR